MTSTTRMPQRGLSTRELGTGLLTYGGLLSGVCFSAGAMVIWVRFEAIAGAGTHAVLSADRGEFFATGVFALLGVVLRVLGLVALGAAFIHFSLRYWPRLKARVKGASRPIVRSRLVGFASRHGWLVHAVLPILAVVLVSRWGLLSALDVQLPRGLRAAVGLVALASIFCGLVRALAAGLVAAFEGRTWGHRQLRWILPLLLATLVFLVLDSWATLLTIVAVGGFVPYAIRAAGRHGNRIESDPWYVMRRERKAIAALVVTMCVAIAIGDEADRPSGLNAVWVTPATGEAFGAIALGERHGMDVFLKITKDARIVRDGEIAMPPTQVKTVEHMYTLDGARNDRPLAKRLYDWLRRPTPSLRS